MSTPTFHVGTEVFSATMNSGVMYLNASTLARELPAMLRYAVERRFRFLALDQSWLAEWFAPNLAAHKPRRADSPGWQVDRSCPAPPPHRVPARAPQPLACTSPLCRVRDARQDEAPHGARLAHSLH